MPLCMFSLMRLSLIFRAPMRINDIAFFILQLMYQALFLFYIFFDHVDTLKVVLVLTKTALCVDVIKKW